MLTKPRRKSPKQNKNNLEQEHLRSDTYEHTHRRRKYNHQRAKQPEPY